MKCSSSLPVMTWHWSQTEKYGGKSQYWTLQRHLSASRSLAPSLATLLQYRQQRLWMDHIFSVKQNIGNKTNRGTPRVWNLMGANATFSQWPTKGETPSQTPFGYNKRYWLHVHQMIVFVESFCDDIELSSKNTNFQNKRKSPHHLKTLG